VKEKPAILIGVKIIALVSFLAAVVIMIIFGWSVLAREFSTIDSRVNLPVVRVSVKKYEEDKEFKTKYDRIINQLTRVEDFSIYEEIFKQDPFSRKKTFKVDLPFKLIKVEPIPYEVIYMGYIEMPDGSQVGQFNVEERTKFVRVGDIINGSELLNITREKAKLVDPEGGLVELKSGRVSFYDVFQAQIENKDKNEQVWVKPNEEAWGYKVLDITEDSVIIYINNSSIILRKE